VQFHDAIGEAIKKSIFDIEKEKLFLKERIKKLEKTLIPKPLFSEPIEAINQHLPLKMS
jgi:hypothetical protein